MAKDFGFGTLTHIGFQEEVYGKLPSMEYMKGAGIKILRSDKEH